MPRRSPEHGARSRREIPREDLPVERRAEERRAVPRELERDDRIGVARLGAHEHPAPRRHELDARAPPDREELRVGGEGDRRALPRAEEGLRRAVRVLDRDPEDVVALGPQRGDGPVARRGEPLDEPVAAKRRAGPRDATLQVREVEEGPPPHAEGPDVEVGEDRDLLAGEERAASRGGRDPPARAHPARRRLGDDEVGADERDERPVAREGEVAHERLLDAEDAPRPDEGDRLLVGHVGDDGAARRRLGRSYPRVDALADPELAVAPRRDERPVVEVGDLADRALVPDAPCALAPLEVEDVHRAVDAPRRDAVAVGREPERGQGRVAGEEALPELVRRDREPPGGRLKRRDHRGRRAPHEREEKDGRSM